MTEESHIAFPNATAEKFYDGAYGRIWRITASLAAMFAVAATVGFGWRMGISFMVGSGLGTVNFLWLKRAITTFAGRMVEPNAVPDTRVRASAVRFVARYALVGGTLYVIFTSSVVNTVGVLVGLFLPVAAILIEAVYETYVGLSRGY